MDGPKLVEPESGTINSSSAVGTILSTQILSTTNGQGHYRSTISEPNQGVQRPRGLTKGEAQSRMQLNTELGGLITELLVGNAKNI